MYFLPKWDFFLFEEIKSINSNLFYFSSSQISHIPDKGGKGIANHVFLMQVIQLKILKKSTFRKF